MTGTKTARFGSFSPGLNNRREPTKMATALADRSSATYQYANENTDISKEGFIQRRPGRTRVVAGRAHSLWSDTRGACIVVDGALCALSERGTSVRAVVRAGIGQSPVSYSRGADGDLYWSDARTLRRIRADADHAPHTETFTRVPRLSIEAGGLPAGRYLLALTRVAPDGAESAATPVQALDLPAGSAVAIEADPQPGGTTMAVYLSGPDGDILTLQAQGSGPLAVAMHTDAGRRCATLDLAAMPPGRIVRHFRSRLLVAVDALLVYSEPYLYGLYRPSANYLPFPAPITVIEPTDEGLWICADKTYWLPDLGGTLQEKLPYGGLPGSSGRTGSGDEVFWQSARGLVVANAAGTVNAVQEAVLAFGPATAGASVRRERDGQHHILTTRTGAAPPGAAATSWMDAEIVSNGEPPK